MMQNSPMIVKSLPFVFLILLSETAVGQTQFGNQLADSAFTLTYEEVSYDPSYYQLDYPNGDVPAGKGVCTDVVIRAYRMFAIDLQKLVHEDMRAHFNAYPNNWGLDQPDKNIDHRRVPNLMTYFERYGQVKNISSDPNNYKPGDIVCWNLGGGITHIGIVSNKLAANSHRYMIIHNIGSGQVLQDMLFDYKIIGHYTYQ